MRLSLTFAALLVATPAFAHHEVLAATSLMPLAGGLAAITIAVVAAWRDRRSRRRSR